jgi:hypothetical protein
MQHLLGAFLRHPRKARSTFFRVGRLPPLQNPSPKKAMPDLVLKRSRIVLNEVYEVVSDGRVVGRISLSAGPAPSWVWIPGIISTRHPVAVVLDLVHPLRAAGRALRGHWEGRLDEGETRYDQHFAIFRPARLEVESAKKSPADRAGLILVSGKSAASLPSQGRRRQGWIDRSSTPSEPTSERP